MHQIEVQVAGPQPPEAALAGLLDTAAAGVLRVDLADDWNTWSRRPARASPRKVSVAPSPYIWAVSISVRPQLDKCAQRRGLLSAQASVHAHAPSALAKHRDRLLAA